jgi:hypothetical protein
MLVPMDWAICSFRLRLEDTCREVYGGRLGLDLMQREF